ncbi:MAG: GTP 3',8-cyclase MoaA [Kofleriaceae bacterium]
MSARVHLPMLEPRRGPSAAPGESGRVADPLLDPQARRVRYLRISVTDRCNYRCVYCMPADAALTFQPRAELLTFEELERLAGVFARLGVRKLRLTGGEPTVRAGVVDLVARLAAVPGIEQVVMTSNGHLLGELARPLAAAGLRSVNVSIDSADPARFRSLTSHGDLDRVLAGIDAARAAGLAVKLNAVAVEPGPGDEAAAAADLVALCRLAWARELPLRFIEPMPMSSAAYFVPAQVRTAARLRAAIEGAFGAALEPADAADADAADADAGPARYWRLGGDPARTLGIISAMTEHFCDRCNRLRLTATGELHACLGHDDAVSLRDVVRAGGDDAAVEAAIAIAVGGKRPGHEFLPSGAGAPAKHMITMGG